MIEYKVVMHIQDLCPLIAEATGLDVDVIFKRLQDTTAPGFGGGFFRIWVTDEDYENGTATIEEYGQEFFDMCAMMAQFRDQYGIKDEYIIVEFE